MLDFYTRKMPKATKSHKCSLCGGEIHKGEIYHRYSGKYDGDFFDDSLHLTCQNIISKYCEENNDNEYDESSIQDWLHDKHCFDCKHHEDNDNDCDAINMLLCPIIRSQYEKKRKNK